MLIKTKSISNSFFDYDITSHFQPIFSLSHKKVIGHEALMRGKKENLSISPLEIINSVKSNYGSTLALDRLAIKTHIENFTIHNGDDENWLFLNMDAEVFSKSTPQELDDFLNEILSSKNISPHQIIIELLEQAVTDDTSFIDNAQTLKEKGFLIAIDDFGSGHSNFDRIWNIMPNIVKLDRSLILNAVKDNNVKRIIPRITSILHESGSLVLMEGIENIHEAQIALDSDIDFVQGFFFGRPQEKLLNNDSHNNALHQVWDNFHNRSKVEYSEYKKQIAPYYNAIGYAASLLSAGKEMEEACLSFLDLPLSKFCYLLDENGTQIGLNINAHYNNNNPKFKPLKNAENANWGRRPYFQKALQHFNKVQVSRSYLSIESSELCRTISCSFKINGRLYVLCGDIISKV